jgi:hypothetical protein
MQPTAGSPALLCLRNGSPLAVGQLRQIFQHPHEPDLLVKVLRPDAIARRWGAGVRWYKRLPRARHYTGYVRELKEYIATCARHPDRHAPIARIVGLAPTDLGLGLVVEKVRGSDGALAPTLATRYATEGGFSAAIEQDLAEFVHGLLACNVIVGDLHAWNLVYGTDSRGGPRFVMVDGFGEKLAIPLTSMSRRYNRHNTLRRIQRMRLQLPQLVPLPGPAAG